MRKSLVFAAVLAATALAASAQQPKTPPPADVPKLVENIDVRVINIDVVVTDKKGTPIHGLTKDDFTIYENGKAKPVSNFYEVSGNAPIPETPTQASPAIPPRPVRVDEIPDNQKRRIIFFVDNLSLSPFNRNRVFKNMKDFIEKVMRPGDEAMLATYNRSMKVRVPFTRDPVQLQQTLDVIAGESGLGINAKNDRKDAEDQIKNAQSYNEAVAAARTYAESVMHDLRQSTESINALMSTLAGVEGKKVLVLTSEGFPMQPGKEVFAYLDDVAKEKNWPSTSALEALSFDAHEQIRSIAQNANANGITMYTVHAGGLAAVSEVSAENNAPVSFSVSQAAITNSTDSMQLMAEMTGGLASLQTNNFGAAFEKIRNDLDSYYSLGYRAGTERVDRQRSLEVRVKNRNYVVRNRQSFVEKSTYADMSDRVIANLLYASKANDLRIVVKAGEVHPTDDEDLFRVPVEVQIPMESLTLLPEGETGYAGGFDVYVVVSNKDGDMSDVARRTNQVHVPKSDMTKINGKYYTYTLDLLMERGLNKLSVGVIDSISSVTGFGKTQIVTSIR